jgi:UrcA family protein
MKTITLHNTRHLAMTAIAAIGLAVAAVGARAGETDEVPTRTVRYSDLDLGTQRGVAVLYNRIRQAAQQVCGDPDSRRLAEWAAVMACRDRAVESGVRAVNVAGLTALYDSRHGAKTISLATLR